MVARSASIQDIRRDVLPFVSDEECKVLSYIYLGGDIDKVNKKTIISLLSKGLLIENDNHIEVSKDGEDSISYYPLFGNYKETRQYPYQFIPMLLSLIANGSLSQKESLWTRFLTSEFFTSIFISKDKDKATKSGIKAVHSLLSLGVAREDVSRVILDKEKSLEFFNLDEYTRLAYLLFPTIAANEIKKAARAINLAFRLRGIKKDDINLYFGIIYGITGFDLSKHIEELCLFDILYIDEDGSYSATTLVEYSDIANGIISSDFIYTEESPSKTPLFAFLSPIKADITNQWAITKSSIRNAFSFGYTNHDVKEFLSSIARFPLSSTIRARIDSWYESFTSLRAKRALTLIANDRTEKIIENLPLLKIHILERIGNVFIMNPDSEAEWRNILTYSGFDMLENTEGPAFSFLDGDSKSFLNIDFPKELPIERKAPYEKEKLKVLTLNEENRIKKAYMESGVIPIDDLDVKEANGLFFQEKLNAITEAIDAEKVLYVEYINGEYELILPLSLEKGEETLLISKAGRRCVDKIWKVAVLDSFIKEKYLSTLDNDNQ